MLKSSICLVYSVGKLFRAFHKKMLDSGKQIKIIHSRAVHVEDSITPELAFTLTLRKFDWEYGKIPIWMSLKVLRAGFDVKICREAKDLISETCQP